MRIYLSPSGQTYNEYAYGNTTEADQCDKIGDACYAALKRAGFDVKKAPKCQKTDTNVKQSNEFKADYHICIHTNAIGGDNSRPSAEGCVIFVDPRNISLPMPYAILDELNKLKGKNSIYGVREHKGLYEINATSAKCIYIECEFHDNASLARWIIAHTTDIGEAIARGICMAEKVDYVKTENDMEKAKAKAIETGLIKGYANGEYGWKDPLTREQLVTILYRAGLI